MKASTYFLIIIFLLSGCTPKQKILFDSLENTYLIKTDFNSLPNFTHENYLEVIENFKNNCRTKKAKNLYEELCEEVDSISNAELFIRNSFTPYIITTKENKQEGLLTGYYEPELKASLQRHGKYQYPLYETPKDLIVVDLSLIYPSLKNYRLRGRVVENRLVPYDTRKESKSKSANADIICYCDSQIDKFFLEIQGSGRLILDDNTTMYVGYDNQNGHKYRAIGRYLVKIGALSVKEVSLQSIREWLEKNPSRVDEVLNYNKSLVYFKQREQGATGALGLELTPTRSVAVDRRYIPLGSMLYLHSTIGDKEINKIVFAQDTGGAIKGSVRADLFLGTGEEALELAGKLKSELKLWILLPKTKKEKTK
ncbi:MltA domain-containing protein [Sulfurimonas sp. SAG-AH-194-L11]|nr:MltA domain-containing protein [Sulfurimonas sp. SAG-AH-194-L11]MDF1877158.1 MltA domain-containing protein [Sulfurimonas sp. SAG-AH-194-L11]